MRTKSPRRMHRLHGHTLRHYFFGALLILAVPVVAGTLMTSHPVEAASTTWVNEGCSGCGTATWCNVYGGQSHSCHSGNAGGTQCSTNALCHWSSSSSTSSSSSSTSASTSGTASNNSSAGGTGTTTTSNSKTGWKTSGLQQKLTHSISSTTSGFQSTGTSGQYTYNSCASQGAVLAYNAATGRAYCKAGNTCPAGESQINGDGVCQGTGSNNAGTYAQWTFSACQNGMQTEYSHNVNTGAVTSTSQVSCVSGSPGSTAATPSTTTTTSGSSGSGSTYVPPANNSSSCPSGETLKTQTTYTTKQQYHPTYTSQTYTYTVSVPVTETGTRYVTQAYTTGEQVPVTAYYWDSNMNCWNNWFDGPNGWYSVRACNGGWGSDTTYQSKTVTSYRTVPQTYTYTAYQNETRTGTRQVATGGYYTTTQVPTTTTSCVPNVTVTSHTITSSPGLSACMPNPASTTYKGQAIQPPANDNWVKQGGAAPNRLLPGPGWAIEKTIKTKVTNTCQGSGSSRTCTTTDTPVSTAYQEQYNPTQCPYPVEQFTNTLGSGN